MSKRTENNYLVVAVKVDGEEVMARIRPFGGDRDMTTIHTADDGWEFAEVGGEKEKRNAREWERMVDAYGTLEGWLCPCGFSSAGAWNYCPSCGSEMYGGEKHED